MTDTQNQNKKTPVGTAIEIVVSLGLVLIIVLWCFEIISPFISVVTWATIIAVSIYTPFLNLSAKLGGRPKSAVAIIILLGLALILVPSWMFTGSTIDSVKTFHESVEAGTFDVAPPSESVREWPLVGEKIYPLWVSAADDFSSFMEEHSEQFKSIASGAVEKATGLFFSIAGFIVSLLIAGVFLVSHESVHKGMLRFCRRVAGEDGDKMLTLSAATVRSVTVGVLGIAVIQAIGTGLGMFLVGVPAAGILALIVLILVIAQLPALLVMLPVIIYVFSIESTTVAVIFAIWSIAVSMSDVVLKPMLLGRGVEAPMLVILLGAIGGMMMSGIMGLFVGAVVMALGYKLFVTWLAAGDNSSQASSEA